MNTSHLKPALLVAAVAACVGGCRSAEPREEPPAPVSVHCVAAARGEAPDRRTLRGTVAAAPGADAIVSPEVAGRLLRVLVREGDVVRPRQIVAEVEGRPMRDALDGARAQLDQAEATAANDADVVAREERLFERGISARQAVEAARTAQRRDVAAVASARAALDLATHNVDRSHVRTPIGGVVLRVLRREGELVDGTPATPVLEVADPDSLELVASAVPADLIRLRPGLSGEARFDALPGTVFPLRVRSVSPYVDSTSGVGVVRFSLDASETRPPFGLLGEVIVDVGTRTDAITVPAVALRNPSPEGSEVVVCEGNVARVHTVVVKERLADRVIVEGIPAGTRVAVDEVTGLEDGVRIRVLP